MTKDTMNLISALANNDIKRAKGYAKVVVSQCRSTKDIMWCKDVYKKLDTADTVSQANLPANIMGYCKVETDFNEDRYYLRDAEKTLYNKIMERYSVCNKAELLGLTMINSTLLYGKPGVGKTLFAKYVAYKLGKPLLYLRFSELIDSYLGKTSNNIGNVFKYVNTHDVVLMLDEIDTVARKRDGESGCDGELSRVTVTIMQELDSLRAGTVVIAATNRVDILDDALFRRFAFVHEVLPATIEEKKCVVEKLWGSLNLKVPDEAYSYCEGNSSLSDIYRDNLVLIGQEIAKMPVVDIPIYVRLEDVPIFYQALFLYIADNYCNCGEEVKKVYEDYAYLLDLAKRDSFPAYTIAMDKRVEEMRYSLELAREYYIAEVGKEPSMRQIVEIYEGVVPNTYDIK